LQRLGRMTSASPGGGSNPVSPIEFRLDAASGVPTYLQLVHQVEHALRLGYLKPGDQLPKVRDVVASLAINPNTVSKAARSGHVHPGHSQSGRAPRAHGSPTFPARMARQGRHGGAGRDRHRGPRGQ